MRRAMHVPWAASGSRNVLGDRVGVSWHSAEQLQPTAFSSQPLSSIIGFHRFRCLVFFEQSPVGLLEVIAVLKARCFSILATCISIIASGSSDLEIRDAVVDNVRLASLVMCSVPQHGPHQGPATLKSCGGRLFLGAGFDSSSKQDISARTSISISPTVLRVGSQVWWWCAGLWARKWWCP